MKNKVCTSVEEKNEETTPLLPELTKSDIFVHKNKKRVFGYFLATSFLLLSVGFSTYSVYLHFDGRTKLQVLEFNVWGMPGKFLVIFYCELKN